MSAKKLTDRQRRVLRAMSHTWEFAYDIAQRAKVDNRAAGAILVSLAQRGLVIADDRTYGNPKLYRWRLK